MHIYNGFTWLLISLSCDFNLLKEGSVTTMSEASFIREDELLRKRKESIKMKVNLARRTVLHLLLLGMLLMSVFGTMFHQEGDSWCIAVTVSVVISSFLPLVAFGAAVFFYA